MFLLLEIFHHIKTHGPSCCPLLSLKLDITKAYNLVEWVPGMYYIAIRFARDWVSMVMKCEHTISY